MLDIVLYLIAAACFVAAALNATVRINLIAAGLLAWILVPLLGELL